MLKGTDKTTRHSKKPDQISSYSTENLGEELDDYGSGWICILFWGSFASGFFFVESEEIILYIGAVAILTLVLCIVSRTFRSSIFMMVENIGDLFGDGGDSFGD